VETFFDVPVRTGPPVRVQANSPQEAELAVAGMFAPHENGVLPNQAVAVAPAVTGTENGIPNQPAPPAAGVAGGNEVPNPAAGVQPLVEGGPATPLVADPGVGVPGGGGLASPLAVGQTIVHGGIPRVIADIIPHPSTGSPVVSFTENPQSYVFPEPQSNEQNPQAPPPQAQVPMPSVPVGTPTPANAGIAGGSAPIAGTPQAQVQGAVASPEAQAIEERYQSSLRLADSWAKNDPEKAGKMRKAAGMIRAAEVRKLTGNLTGKEQQAKAKREASNYTGKPVVVGGQTGKVAKTAFGKVVVAFDNGETRSVNPDEIFDAPATPKPAAVAKARTIIAEHRSGVLKALTPEILSVAQETGMPVTNKTTLDEVVSHLDAKFPTVKIEDIPKPTVAKVSKLVTETLGAWKKNPAINSVLKLDTKFTAKAETVEGSGVHLNPQLLVQEIATAGLSDTDAKVWLDRVLFEELHHLSQLQTFREIYLRQVKAKETKLSFEKWREAYSKTLIQEFKSIKFLETNENGDTVEVSLYEKAVDAYGVTLKAKGTPAWIQVSEINRMILQDMMTGNPTEATKAALGVKEIRDFINQALESLKAFVAEFRADSSNFSKDLIENMDRVEELLKQYGITNVTDQNQSRPRTPKADSAQPAQSKPSVGTSITPAQGGDSSPSGNGGTQQASSNGAGSPLQPGQRVEFEHKGIAGTGVVRLASKEAVSIYPDSNPGAAILVPVGSVRSVVAPLADTPQTPAAEKSPVALTPEEESQKAYTKLKSSVAKAQRSEKWSEVVSLIDQAEKDFTGTNGFSDQWQNFERYREDAQEKLTPRSFVTPILKPYVPSAPALTPDEQALKDAFSDMVDGLEAAPLIEPDPYQSKGIPRDKRATFMDVADQLYDAGVRTPADLAAKLEKVGGGKLRAYSDAVWSVLRSNYPTLPQASDWAGVYAGLDKPANQAEAGSDFNNAKGKVLQSVSNNTRDMLLDGETVTVDRIKSAEPLSSTLTRKELDEAIEAGITAAAHQMVKRVDDYADGTDNVQERTFNALVRLYDRQPSLNAKTSTSKINQAYSTPSPLAYVASRLADIAGGKVLVEPTGGHGMLLMESTADQVVQFNEIDDARHERTKLAISESSGWTMTSEDATSWTPSQSPDRIAANPPFGSVMAEDGSNIAWITAAGKTSTIDHAIMLKQLGSMTPDGRAVFIIGGPAKTARSEAARKEHYGRGAKAAFFKHLHDNFGVVDHFTVDGDLYAKQGAGWNVDVIVIQGRKASRTSLPSAKAPRMLATWDDVFQTTQLTDEQRIQLNRLSEEEVRDSVRGMVDALAGIGNVGRPQISSSRPESSGGQDGTGGTTRDTVSSESSETESGDNQGTGGVGGERDGVVGDQPAGVEQGTEPSGENSGTRGSSDPSGNPAGAVRTPVKESGKFQAEYTPFSGEKGLDTLLPRNMVGPVADAFARIKRDLGGNLTKFVHEKLGYPEGVDIIPYLAGEQIDAVAAAIWNFEKGGALIVGDQTGIGKGRIAAALMKYAVNQGYIPVFMTKDSGLHDTMLTEDLPDIAAPEIIPAVMDTQLQFTSAKKQKLDYGQEYFANLSSANGGAAILTPEQIKSKLPSGRGPGFDYELVAPGVASRLVSNASGTTPNILPDWHIVAPGLFTVGRGKTAMDAYRGYLDHIGENEEQAPIKTLPGKSNAIFVTYSQIQSDDAKGLTKRDRATARNAGEPPADNWRMRTLRRLAPNAVFILDESHLASGQSTTGWRVADIIGRSPRVYYSSATSVKRPENMGIYFKTNVGMLTNGNMADLTDLMNRGGVPAMQVVSSMLAQDGQYLRRERSFDGVSFTTQIAEESSDRDRDLADALTGSLREIVTVQDAMRQAAEAINSVIAAAGRRMSVPAANRAKLETVNFSSKLHNIVGQYLLAIKTQSAADTAIREIRAGKKVVVALQSTMESAIDALETGGFEMSYKGLVLRYLDQMRFLNSGNRAFGRGEVETFEVTEDGLPEFEELSSRELEARIVSTSRDPETGDTIILINEDVAAELMRRAMWDVFVNAREQIEKADLGDLPLSPIDAMRQAVEREGIRTGEITGRKRGIDVDGEIYARSAQDTSKPARRVVQSAFNNEDLDFLVINQSGSTGISLHASEKAKNQATRVMVVAQPNLDINEFMQTLGRIHRSGQVVKPEFILLQTALPAEKRPAAILGKKMSMLNANTTSNAKTDVSEGNTAVDIFNQYGDEVAYRVFERDPDLQRQLRPLGSSLAKFFDKLTGNALSFQDAQGAVEDQPAGYIARTITGYLAILPVEEQEIFWEKTIADYQAYISYLDQIGANALEAKALDLQAKTISSEVFTEQAEGDSAFSDPSYIETVETKVGKEPLTGDAAVELARDAKAQSKRILQKYLSDADAMANQHADQKAKRAVKKWDDEKRAEFLSNQRAQRNVIASSISLIGRFGSVKRNDGNSGLGVIEEIKMDNEHLLTPSKQIAVIRVNDSRETLRVPVTQLNEAFTPSPYESAKEWTDTTDVGGESAIATGNLMAAMKALGGSGKVITYTTDTGVDKMGILLPKSFLTKRAAIKARVQVGTAEKLLEMLDLGVQVTNEDGSIKWTKGGNLVTLSVPASRSNGGNIWRHPTLNRNSIGSEFTQVGNEMRATYGTGVIRLVFQIVTEMGETFSSVKSDTGTTLRAAELPAQARHAELEARKDSLTPGELAEAQALVDAAAKAAGYNRKGVRFGFYVDGVPLPPARSTELNFGPGYYVAEDAVLSDMTSDKVSVRPTGNEGEFERLGVDPSKVEFRRDSVYVKAENPLVSANGGNYSPETGKFIIAQLAYDSALQDAKRVLRMPFEQTSWSKTVADLIADSRIPFDSVRGLTGRKGMTSELVVQNPSQIKSADPFTGVPLSERFNSSSPSILQTAPLPSTPAKKARDAFNANREKFENAQEQVKALGSGTAGADPKFANPGASPKARDAFDIARMIDSNQREIKKDRDTHAQGREFLEKYPEEVERLLLESGYGDNPEFTNDYRQHAINLLLNRKAEAASTTADYEQLYMLATANVILGREQARAFRQRMDKFLTPAERAHAAIADAIFTPSKKIAARAEVMKPAERKAFLADEGKKRIAEVEKALAKRDLSIQQIQGKNRDLQLVNSRLEKEVLSLRNTLEQDIIRFVQKGASPVDVRKRFGKLGAEQAKGIIEKAAAEMDEKLYKMLAAGMTMEDILASQRDTLKAAPLAGAAAGMNEAAMRALAMKIRKEQMGIPDAEAWSKSRPLPTARPKKPVTEIEAHPLAANWSRPEFSDHMKTVVFDLKDRHGIMERVEIIRGLAGALGKIDSLTGEKRTKAEAALDDINKTLAKYNTDAKGIFEGTKGIEDYRFDINDVAHVALVARTINSLDADFVDKASEYLYFSMLSGLQTMMVNATAIVPAAWESTVGRGVNMAINHFVKDPMAEQYGEGKYIVRALGTAISRAWSNAQASMAAQHPMFDRDVNAMEVDWDKILGGGSHRMVGSIAGRKGDIIRLPMRLLTATDDFNRTLIAVAEVGTFAYRMAKMDGLKDGSPEMDAFIRKEVNTAGSLSYQMASRKASKAIYSNPLPGQHDPHMKKIDPTSKGFVETNDMGDFVGYMAARLTDAVTGEHDNIFIKALSAALRVAFFPFQRTPFNIIRKGVRHTLNPFSLADIAMGVVRNTRVDGKWQWAIEGDGQEAMNRHLHRAELIERMGQQLQGAVLMTALYALAWGEGDDDDQDQKFIITGSSPFLPTGMAERDARMRSGIGPFRMSWMNKDGSERLGFSYGRIEPVATILAATIDMMKSFKRADRSGKDTYDAGMAAMGGLISQAQDKSFMKGIGDFIKLSSSVMTEPDLRENRKALQFLASRAAMVVPNFIKQPLRESDTQFRDRADGFMQSLMYEVAPIGQKPAKVDPYGKKLTKPGVAPLRPIDPTDIGSDSVNTFDRVLLKWSDKHPDKAWFPSPIMKGEFKHARTGAVVEMNQAQLTEFRDIAGKRVTAMLKRAGINMQNPTELDLKKIKEAHTDARSEAKKLVAFKYSR
jgi:hypothetical protein